MDLFVHTVRLVCLGDYDSEQINCWVSATNDKEKWLSKIENSFFIVAEADNRITGFASLESFDYIDLLYVHHNYLLQGIGHALFIKLEQESLKNNITKIYTDASITSVNFFKKQGFNGISKQIKTFHNTEFINYKMSKTI